MLNSLAELEARLAQNERQIVKSRFLVQDQRMRLETLRQISSEGEVSLAALSTTLEAFLWERDLLLRQADEAVRAHSAFGPVFIQHPRQ